MYSGELKPSRALLGLDGRHGVPASPYEISFTAATPHFRAGWRHLGFRTNVQLHRKGGGL